MLTLLDGGAATAHTVASLRAACEVSRVSAGRVTAVSLRGRVPDGDRSFEVSFGPRSEPPNPQPSDTA